MHPSCLVDEALAGLGDGRLLTPEGQVVAECFVKRTLQPRYARLQRTRVARFGDVVHDAVADDSGKRGRVERQVLGISKDQLDAIGQAGCGDIFTG